jgi:UrcA family protein
MNSAGQPTTQETIMNTITSTRFRGLIATAIVSALASSFTAVCAAADSTDAPTAIVKYGDLNVSTSQGAASLYWRIRMAAETVCRPLDGGDLASKMRNGACVSKAIADAVTKVDQPELFDVYNAKNTTRMPANLLSQSR